MILVLPVGTPNHPTTNYNEETKHEVKFVCYTVYLPGGRSLSVPTKLFMSNSCVYTQARILSGRFLRKYKGYI